VEPVAYRKDFDKLDFKLSQVMILTS